MSITIAQFVERLTDSGLMTAQEIDSFQRQLPPELQPKDVQQFTQVLIQQRKLTKYQAQAVYQGKTKGLVFGEYVVVDKLGEGGMGVVLKAQHRRMKRFVAVKMISRKAIGSPDAVKRFYREVEAAAKLNHPNIVHAYDANEHEGVHYLVMEFVEGKDLAAIVKDHGPMAVHAAVECILQAGRGLQYAHDKRIVHRDIKPSNLLMDKEGTVKILDMGLARVAGLVDDSDQDRLTGTDQVMGTCDYMAPEQALDTHNADTRADIYSLGCTLYRLLTGRVPYKGETLMQILMAHQQAPIPSLCKMRPDVPPQLDAVFRKMVAKEPENRYQSMAKVLADLEAVLAVLPSLSAPAAVAKAEPSSSALAQTMAFLQEDKPVGLVAVQPKTTASEETQPSLSRQETATSILGKARWTIAGIRRKPLMLVGLAVGLVLLLGIILHIKGKSGGETAIALPENNEVTAQEKMYGVRREPAEAVIPNPKESPVLGGQEIDLLIHIDLKRDAVVALWRFEGGKLIIEGNQDKDAVLMLPVSPTEQYRLEFCVTRTSGTDSFNVGLVVGGHPCVVTLDGWNRHLSLVEGLDGKRDSNETARSDLTFTNGKPSNVVITVGRGQILVEWDGRKAIDWHGDPSRLSFSPKDKPRERLAEQKRLFIGAGSSTYRIEKAVFRSLSSSGTVQAGVAGSQPPLAAAPFDAKKAKEHQAAWAKHLGVPVEIANSIGIKLVLIPPGEFEMGSAKGQANEKPIHKVTITRPFYLGKYKVTVAQFRQFVEATQYQTEAEKYNNGAALTGRGWGPVAGVNWRSPTFSQQDDHPVCAVSWKDIEEFCKWASKQTGSTVYLPTEAQWEYACRAGTNTRFNTGDTEADLEQAAWTGRNSGHRTHPVGQKKPNAWGLYDMHGNVYDMVQDYFSANYYAESPVADPKGPPKGDQRLIRGGGWGDGPDYCSAAGRHVIGSESSIGNGFRVALVLADKPVLADRPAKSTEPPLSDDDRRGSWQDLFDGKSLNGWEVVRESEFSQRVRVENGEIVLDSLSDKQFAGIRLAASDVFRTDYEVAFKTMRTLGEHDFASLTFPVGNSSCSFIMAGFDGKVVGFDTVDGARASDHASSRRMQLLNDRWYQVRVRVTPERIEAWIDDQKTCELTLADHEVGTSQWSVPMLPFGFHSWLSTGRLRDIRVRSSKPGNGRQNAQSADNQTSKPTDTTGSPPPAVAPFDAKKAKEHQAAWAKHLGVLTGMTDTIGMELVLVPPGEFMMGSNDPESQPREKPVHRVRISKPFFIGKYPVTITQFKRFVDATKYRTEAEVKTHGYAGWGIQEGKWLKLDSGIDWRNPRFEQTPDHPVVMVSSNDAREFCKWASTQTGHTVRLPTEAEWEYAARGPNSLKYPWGDRWDAALVNHADKTLRETGYHEHHADGDLNLRYPDYNLRYGGSESDRYAYTSPVGALKNASWCGAHDMVGNVWQWCQDWLEDRYYAISPTEDPKGAPSAILVTRRAGSWVEEPGNCRCAQRYGGFIYERDAATGIRIMVECAVPTAAGK